MKGLIVFYINYVPEHNQDQMSQIEIMLKINQHIIEKLKSTGDYEVVIVPCTKEACRVEKIDFDKPHPRFVSRTHADLDKRSESRAASAKLGE